MSEVIKHVVMMKLPQNIFSAMQADLEEEGSWLTVLINVYYVIFRCWRMEVFEQGQHDGCWQRSHSLGMGGCQLPVVPPTVTLFGFLPSLSVSAGALSTALEQPLTTEPAEHVCNSIFKATLFHLMTLRLKKKAINWRETEKSIFLECG